MEKRTWCYLLKPTEYDMRCDKCWSGDLNDGTGKNITWSEYKGHIWCYDCEIDTKGFQGIFGGPIPIHATYMLGLHFNRINFNTGKVEYFNLRTWKWDTAETVKEVLSKKNITKDILRDKQIDADPYGIMLRRTGEQVFGVDENNNIFLKNKEDKITKDNN
jgi:hypothetical protein